MRVLKFGGTSVGNAEAISKVVDIVQHKHSENKAVAVVVSALKGITDQLEIVGKKAASGDEAYLLLLKAIETRHIEEVQLLVKPVNQSKILGQVKILLNELEDIARGVFLTKELTKKTKDRLLSFGERLSSLIVSNVFVFSGIPCEWIDSRTIIKTDDNYTSANVNFESSNQLIKERFLGFEGVALLPGFIASNENNDTTTLGRGGSDYTASILSAALEADALEIWTDVSGIMTSDPRVVDGVMPIQSISYEEAMELSHFGAKVIYPPTIHPVLKSDIPVLIKNTFDPKHEGTVISNETGANGQDVRGLSSIDKIALLSLTGSGMVGIPGFARRLFFALSKKEVNVILITQASSEHSITVAINESEVKTAVKSIEKEFKYELDLGKVRPVDVQKELAIVAIVGDKMKHRPGIAGKVFSALGQNAVNIHAIAQGSSERNISVVIEAKDEKKALNVLHESFFLSHIKTIHLFIIGVGLVGKALIQQLKSQHQFLLSKYNLNLKVAGLANSKSMYLDAFGVDLNDWESKLKSENSNDPLNFVQEARALNLRNSIVVDNTASSVVSDVYEAILKASMSIVTPNKIAASSKYSRYLNLKDLAKRNNAEFYYETNVGAGLPIIHTLNDLVKSGDRVIKIQAVLSGSLNFIFNEYNAANSFYDVVLKAKEEGYTEPDPRIDLSGTDVMRKILILAREAGEELEMEAVKSKSFMPAACDAAGSVEAFMEAVQDNESHFSELRKRADEKGEKLKVVASFENGKAEVALQSIDSAHPFFHLDGKDNIVLINTDRYKEQPLAVKGAGAGAEVTASGVFADIMRAANSLI